MNRKGFTTVEVLVCFVIVSIVMMSMFSTISAFNEKKTQESNRSKVYEFKNEITNVIQEDLVRRGLQFVKIQEDGEPDNCVSGKNYSVEFTFGDGTQKKLNVHQRFTRTSYRASGCTSENDEFYIEYGYFNSMIRYDLPDLGSTKGYYRPAPANPPYETADTHGRCHNAAGAEVSCYVAQDFQINNVEIYISNEADLDAESHIFNLYIGFYHPDLGTKYAINIVSPINYHANIGGFGNTFHSSTSSGDQYSDSVIYQYEYH